MRSAKLRQSGGSVIVSLPKAYLDELGLKADASVDIDLVEDKIVIARRNPGRIGLDARLAMCNPALAETPDEREWLDAPAVGDEVI
jgi:antitoxin ChpS